MKSSSTDSGKNDEHVFTSIERTEYNILSEFLSNKNLKIKNLQTAETEQQQQLSNLLDDDDDDDDDAGADGSMLDSEEEDDDFVLNNQKGKNEESVKVVENHLISLVDDLAQEDACLPHGRPVESSEESMMVEKKTAENMEENGKIEHVGATIQRPNVTKDIDLLDGRPGGRAAAKEATRRILHIPLDGLATGDDESKASGNEPRKRQKNSSSVVQRVNWVECDRCGKWRKLPAHISLDLLPETWFCEMNSWDTSTANCQAPEPIPSPVKKSVPSEKDKATLQAQVLIQPSTSLGEEEKKNDGQESPPSNGSSIVQATDSNGLSRPLVLSVPSQYELSGQLPDTSLATNTVSAPQPAMSHPANLPRLSVLPPPHHFMNPFSGTSPMHAMMHHHLGQGPRQHHVFMAPPHYQHLQSPTSSHPHGVISPSMQQLAGMFQQHPHFFGPLAAGGGLLHPGTPVSLGMNSVYGAHPMSLNTLGSLYPNGVVTVGGGTQPRPQAAGQTSAPLDSSKNKVKTEQPRIVPSSIPTAQPSNAGQANHCQPTSKSEPSTKAPIQTEANLGQKTEALFQWVQCDRCQKWRRLPGVLDTKNLPEKWFCEMNVWDNSRRTCEAPEETEPVENHDKEQQQLLSLAKSGSIANKAKQGESKRSGKRGAGTKSVTKSKVTRVNSISSIDTTSSPPVPQRRASTNEQQQSVQQRKVEQNVTITQSTTAWNNGVPNGTTKRIKPVWNWVQCEKRSCRKWRRLPQDIDPESLPERWVCAMNSWDPRFASCMADEEDADEVDAEDGAEPVCVSVVNHTNGSNDTTVNKDPGKLSYRELIFTAEGKLRPPFSDRASLTSIFAIGTRINNGKLHDIEAYADSPYYDSRGRDFDTSRASTGPKSGKGSRSFLL
mmetsp:Transcript_5400/g.6918  ORF Transcript_5400/g.6918 Transcript_5400/m.6918 type:complete len:890 (-) Transcript_5400:291-2960(-)